MARFILTDKHYLNVPGTIWEQKEVDQATGKQVRKDYPVGLYLDPKDPADWNYPQQIIVATKRSVEHPADIIFFGPPTFDMTPIDDEAKAMVAGLTKKDPFSELPGTVGETFSEKMIGRLEQLIQQQAEKNQPVSQTIAEDRVAKLEEELAEMRKLLASAMEAKSEPVARRA